MASPLRSGQYFLIAQVNYAQEISHLYRPRLGYPDRELVIEEEQNTHLLLIIETWHVKFPVSGCAQMPCSFLEYRYELEHFHQTLTRHLNSFLAF